MLTSACKLIACNKWKLFGNYRRYMSITSQSMEQNSSEPTEIDQTDQKKFQKLFLSTREQPNAFLSKPIEERKRLMDLFAKDSEELSGRVHTVNEKHWDLILNERSFAAAKNAFRFYSHINFLASLDKIKKDQKKKEIENSKKSNDPDFQTNYPGHSSPFRHISSNSLKQIRDSRLLSAFRVTESPKIVLDFQFHEFNSFKAMRSLVKQFLHLYSDLADDDHAFQIHLCNFDEKTNPFQKFFDVLSIDLNRFVVHSTPKSYLELFPKNKLRYLSPNSKSELVEFDPDHVYIIGMLQDNQNKKPYTYSQAQTEGIKSVRLPLDRIKWGGGGGKDLCINQCASILKELKNTNDWSEAFRYIPNRKLKR